MHRSASLLLDEKMPNDPEFEENSSYEEAEEAQCEQARPANLKRYRDLRIPYFDIEPSSLCGTESEVGGANNRYLRLTRKKTTKAKKKIKRGKKDYSQ